MSDILASSVRRVCSQGTSALVASIRTGQDADEVWFRTAGQLCCPVADPLVPLLLFPAMRLGLPLTVDGPVSSGLLRCAERVQQVKSVWDISIGEVPVRAAEIASCRVGGSAVGCFFSGGVDSFYTLQRHRPEVTHLIFVHGFDIPLRRTAFRERVSAELHRLARELELELVEVETNLRDYSDRYVGWDDYHGAAMAAVAHFLSPGFGKIYFPATYAYAFLSAYGSHPGLDPLWSTESLEIVHDGCEANRFEKIQALTDWEFAIRNLRVCWQCVEGRLNCGRCRKCLWTMAFLRACGALERAETFGAPLDLDALRRFPPTRLDEIARYVGALRAVEQAGEDPNLAEVLRDGLAAARQRRSTEARVGRWIRRIARLIGVGRSGTCDWRT